MNKLSNGERLMLYTGAALLVCAFIPMWMSVSAEAFGVSFSESGNAFQGYGFFPVELGLLLGFAALGLVIAKAAGATFDNPQVYLGLTGAAAALLLIGVITGPEGQSLEVAGAGFEVSRGIMLFVGLVLAAAMAYGAWQHMNTSQEPAMPPPVANPTV